ncbi:hypothetical protein K458DRAFT_408720 [Lentithecium fluviatile CBS 122367]|uniref:Uncharacterized protein n=1 Tax=Lentithecium fluviatile CBS 122367 TaxID=1168545 RepID=A0A6G1IKB2_9PLEO|nr:hypothetical protein K458DRAFT_408720 [Lentithecium fluviatile CBS 122367]
MGDLTNRISEWRNQVQAADSFSEYLANPSNECFADSPSGCSTISPSGCSTISPSGYSTISPSGYFTISPTTAPPSHPPSPFVSSPPSPLPTLDEALLYVAYCSGAFTEHMLCMQAAASRNTSSAMENTWQANTQKRVLAVLREDEEVVRAAEAWRERGAVDGDPVARVEWQAGSGRKRAPKKKKGGEDGGKGKGKGKGKVVEGEEGEEENACLSDGVPGADAPLVPSGKGTGKQKEAKAKEQEVARLGDTTSMKSRSKGKGKKAKVVEDEEPVQEPLTLAAKPLRRTLKPKPQNAPVQSPPSAETSASTVPSNGTDKSKEVGAKEGVRTAPETKKREAVFKIYASTNPKRQRRANTKPSDTTAAIATAAPPLPERSLEVNRIGPGNGEAADTRSSGEDSEEPSTGEPPNLGPIEDAPNTQSTIEVSGAPCTGDLPNPSPSKAAPKAQARQAPAPEASLWNHVTYAPNVFVKCVTADYAKTLQADFSMLQIARVASSGMMVEADRKKDTHYTWNARTDLKWKEPKPMPERRDKKQADETVVGAYGRGLSMPTEKDLRWEQRWMKEMHAVSETPESKRGLTGTRGVIWKV